MGKFLKPGWKKIVLFSIVFLAMFYKLPFLQTSFSGENKTIFQLIKDYSGGKESFYFIFFGLIIYLLASYFISCSAIQIWNESKKRRK